ncbi:MAG: glycosyltransferase family protein [Acetatifactor sp.]|nr:glycosyltransferase family protein [Acetatifactor sp.]
MHSLEVDDRKICFIMCVNDDRAAGEAMYYISRLLVPDGYTVDALQINDAKSMTSGYNEAMQATDAKYKVFMHQDVLIINKNFIADLLGIFKDPAVGMVGMVGSPKMPENCIMWQGPRVGSLYSHNNYQTIRVELDSSNENKLFEVEAIDGFLMATQYDIPWREDVIKGWDFYDVSQSFEFRSKGYKVVVPHQDKPWCLHDDGFLNLRNYYEARRNFKKIYKV